jgi:hypothetical protein
MQHNVIMFVSDLRQVSDFFRVLLFPSSTAKTDHCYISEIVLKVALNTNTLATTKTTNHNFTIQHSLHKHWNLQNCIFTINMEEVPLLFPLHLRRYSYRNWSIISTPFPGISNLCVFCNPLPQLLAGKHNNHTSLYLICLRSWPHRFVALKCGVD